MKTKILILALAAMTMTMSTAWAQKCQKECAAQKCKTECTTQKCEKKCGDCKEFTPEQRAQKMTDRMTKELSLTEAQAKQIHTLFLERTEQVKEHREAMKQMKTDRAAKMKAILTPEQYAKWEQCACQKNTCHKGQKCHKGDAQTAPQGKCCKSDSCNDKK